jgi:acylphosphatase
MGAAECRLVRIEGRVQGVGFREACVDQARSLQLAGWVRNRLDGSVEALLQGPPDALRRMQAWLERGPPAARVQRVQATAQPLPSPPLTGFERRQTA